MSRRGAILPVGSPRDSGLTMTRFTIGDWTVVPALNLLERGAASIKLEPRAMDLLVYLAGARGRVVSADELLREVWRGRVFDEGIVYKRIHELRKALCDDADSHRFIETIPKRGYRLVANVGPADVGSTNVVDESHPAVGARTAAAGSLTAVNGASPQSPIDPAPISASASPPRSARVPIVAALAVCAALAAAALLQARSPRPEAALRFIPLSFEQGQGGDLRWPAVGSVFWSPDGRAITYAALLRPAEPPQAYVRYLDSSTSIAITQKADGAQPKAWTPSGRIVIQSGGPRETSQSAGFWSVSALGGALERLLDVPPGTTMISSWTRDGSTVASLRQGEDGLWGVWVASLPSGHFQRYEPAPFATPHYINRPSLSFSPDGHQLILMLNVGHGDGEEAWLMPYPPDPRRPPRRVLPALPGFGGTPQFSWLPDNRHIVLAAARPGNPRRLFIADTVSGEMRPLSDGASTTHQTFPVVSPDGTKLIFTEFREDSDIVTLNVATGDLAPLMATSDVERMPAWAGDSTLVYVTERGGESQIWLRERDSADRPLVTSQDFPDGTTAALLGPQLSPDRRRVMYARVERNAAGGMAKSRLWMSAVAGGAPLRLTRDSDHESVGSWSPDGDWYVYMGGRVEDGSMALRRVRTLGQAESEALVEHVGRSVDAAPVFSPDGHWILYEDDGLKLLSSVGAETRELGLRYAVCAFASRGEILYCVRNIASYLPPSELALPTTVVAVDFGGRVVREIATLTRTDAPAPSANGTLRLAMTPDAKGISYAVERGSARLLLVEGLDTVPPP